MSDQRRITVVLGDMQLPVGELIFEYDRGRQHSVFRYDQRWLDNPDNFALSPFMPLESGWTAFSGEGRYSLPDPLSDTAPDKWGRSVIQAHRGGRLTELEILLESNDETRLGALRYIDEQGEVRSTDVPTVPRMTSLVDLRRLNENFERAGADRSKIARDLRGSGDSLGGARPKSAIYDGDALAIAKYTSWRDDLPVEQMEVATLNLAKTVGIRASQARIELPNSELPVAIIHRFDRSGVKRKHYISGHSFLNMRDSQDPVYYTDLADIMRGNCGNGEQALGEIRELYRRVMFMILVSNTDDHMKNHGFLMTGRNRWALSPAFDINPQPDRHKMLKTGISEISGFEPSIQALVESAPFFDISEDEASTLAIKMATTIRERWREMCQSVGMSTANIDRYVPAFDHGEMRSALNMAKARVPATGSKRR